ncbi:MAG: MoaD/ThiS family protein [Elusimicrobia bacterium]|nr:MoaD/ThiS family protein [Elusimicrobiota bacterium]
MAVKLLFFAQCAQWMGVKELDVRLGRRPMALDDFLKRPELSPINNRLALIKIAVNEEFAEPQSVVRDGDEIAFLAPVSGG